MTLQTYRHPVADEQTWNEALTENEMRSIVEWREVAGGRSEIGLDKHGRVRTLGCRVGGDSDPSLVAQDLMETGSQVVGADDEWA